MASNSLFDRLRKRAALLVIAAVALVLGGVIAGIAIAAGTGPTVTAVTTRDANADGYLDGVVVTFNMPMDTSVAAPDGFSVTGYRLAAPPSQWIIPANGAPATQLLLNILPNATPDTAATPAVHYATSTTSKPAESAPPLKTEVSPGDFSSKDLAGPVLLKAEANDFAAGGVSAGLVFNSVGDELDFTFSEPVKLAGQKPVDRLKNLDAAVKVATALKQGAVCDGDASDTKNVQAGKTSNLPGLSSNTSTTDPIVSPAAGLSSAVIRVIMLGGSDANTASPLQTAALPGECAAGVDPAGVANITDAAAVPNAAVNMNTPTNNTGLREVGIAPAGLLYDDGLAQTKPGVYTQELSDANGIGKVDTIKITFDHPIDATSITDAAKLLFTIKNGNETATVTGVEASGANLLVHVGSVVWGGDVTPSVSFANVDGAGKCVIQTNVPTAGYHACAASFSNITAQNKVGPVVLSAQTTDSYAPSNALKTVIVTFSKTLSNAVAPKTDGWTVGTVTPSGITVSGATATLTLPDANGLDTGATPNVAFDSTKGNIQDANGTLASTRTVKAADATAPFLTGATSLDTDGDGQIDSVTFSASEPVDHSSLKPGDFTIADAAATGFGSDSSNQFITVTINPQIGGTAAVKAAYTGSALTDMAGNIGGAKSFDATTDGAKPVVLSFRTTPVSPFGPGDVTLEAGFSEPVDVGTAPTAKFGTTAIAPLVDGSHDANGFTSDKLGWAGKVTLTGAACDQQNGCAVDITMTGIKDGATNTAADSKLPVFVDTKAPDAATGELSSPIQAGGASPGDNKISSTTKDLTFTANVAKGQVMTGETGGTAELLIGDASFATPVKTNVGKDDGSVTLHTSFGSASALQQAISEGVHTLSVKLCDGAGNCTTSGGVSVNADYTPVNVDLTAPNSGTFDGGDHACIVWAADSSATDLSDVQLFYVASGINPTQIASGLQAAPSGTCADGTTGYDWTVPGMNTSTLKIIVSTIDQYGNVRNDQSTDNISVQTVTKTVTTIGTSVGQLTNGQALTISGTVTGNGFPVASQKVSLVRKLPGSSSFSPYYTATTAQDGKYSFVIRPPFTADYQVTFAKSGPYLASASDVKHVVVQVSDSINAPSTLTHGQTATIWGYVYPSKAGKKVWVQMFYSGSWHTISTQTLSSKSAYIYYYRSATAAKRQFRTVFPTQDSYNLWGVSATKTITWK